MVKKYGRERTIVEQLDRTELEVPVMIKHGAMLKIKHTLEGCAYTRKLWPKFARGKSRLDLEVCLRLLRLTHKQGLRRAQDSEMCIRTPDRRR